MIEEFTRSGMIMWNWFLQFIIVIISLTLFFLFLKKRRSSYVQTSIILTVFNLFFIGFGSSQYTKTIIEKIYKDAGRWGDISLSVFLNNESYNQVLTFPNWEIWMGFFNFTLFIVFFIFLNKTLKTQNGR